MMLKTFILSFGGLAASQSLTSLLTGNAQLSSLAGLIQSRPELAATLSAATNITILAPNNAAIAALLNSSAALANNTAAIDALLQYHVLAGTYNAASITNKTAFVPSLLTNTAYANVTGGQRVEAVRRNGNVTIVSGLLNNSTVVSADANFTGGVVHVINRVLTVPANVSTTLLTARLSALYGALNATSLLPTVNGLGDVTIFAPSNSAFGNIANLAANLTTEQAASLLQYHVVKGSVGYSSTLRDNQTLSALAGGSLTIHTRGSAIFVNGARVITPDVLIAGGVVHVIDQVLNPSNTTAPGASATAGAVAFSGASSASNVPFTSGVPSVTGTLGGGGAAAATPSTGSSSSAGAAAPMMTGAVGAAALFGAGAALLNL